MPPTPISKDPMPLPATARSKLRDWVFNFAQKIAQNRYNIADNLTESGSGKNPVDKIVIDN